MKEIHLITTPGCEACNIMKNILYKVKKEINIPIIEYPHFLPPEYIDTVTFTDFPTTLFVEDNKVKHIIVGTESVTKIKSVLKELDFV